MDYGQQTIRAALDTTVMSGSYSAPMGDVNLWFLTGKKIVEETSKRREFDTGEYIPDKPYALMTLQELLEEWRYLKNSCLRLHAQQRMMMHVLMELDRRRETEGRTPRPGHYLQRVVCNWG